MRLNFYDACVHRHLKSDTTKLLTFVEIKTDIFMNMHVCVCDYKLCIVVTEHFENYNYIIDGLLQK